VRDGEATLAHCLRSILAGSYPAECLEVVVVDNGSRDRSLEIATHFPVRTVVERRRGRSRARNTGIAHSRGEIVAFIDADCIASRDWLERLTDWFRSEDVWGVAGEIVPLAPA